MRCHEVDALLDLSDLDARFDRSAVGEHLAACSQCACRWPEVAMLTGQGEPAGLVRHRSRPRARRAVAAALIAVAIAGVSLWSAASGRLAMPAVSPSKAGGAESCAPVLCRAVGSSSVSRETITFDRGRRVASRVTHAVWSAPPPKCLNAGVSGT